MHASDHDDLAALRAENAAYEARLQAIESRLGPLKESGEGAERRSRRDLMKLAAATTAGAIGARALSPTIARAGGSSDSIFPVTPTRIVDTRHGLGGFTGARAANTWTTFGPFTTPFLTPFTTTSYLGAVFNLAVTGWSGLGYAAAADSTFTGSGTGAAPAFISMWFGGTVIPNYNSLAMVKFAPGSPSSDGKVSVWVGNSSAHVIIELVALFLPDV